jgi:hypothetical protein
VNHEGVVHLFDGAPFQPDDACDLPPGARALG